jgi:predicted transcriptional regulator
MPDDNINRILAARIVGGYLRRNQVAPDQFPSLISTVHEALGRLGKPAIEPAAEQVPAISARRSISRDHVICMDCGWRGKTLRRHLGTAHGLTPDTYRSRWKLSHDHAMTAPSYSESRSAMAKQIGLGQSRAAKAPAPPQPAPKRRGRPRTKTV